MLIISVSAGVFGVGMEENKWMQCVAYEGLAHSCRGAQNKKMLLGAMLRGDFIGRRVKNQKRG